MDSFLDTQVGGEHYKSLQMQPIVLIAKTNCDYIQGRIIELLARFKCTKNKEDLLKCIHYSRLAIELLPDEKNYLNIGFGYSYAKANSLNGPEMNVVIAVLQRDFLAVIRNCNILIKNLD